MYSHIFECLKEEFVHPLRMGQLRSVYIEYQFSIGVFFFFFFFPEGSFPTEDVKPN